MIHTISYDLVSSQRFGNVKDSDLLELTGHISAIGWKIQKLTYIALKFF